MPDIMAAAADLQNSEEFETILDNWTSADARGLVDHLKNTGWQPIERRSNCAVATLHRTLEKAGVTLDVIAANLVGPFVAITRYTH